MVSAVVIKDVKCKNIQFKYFISSLAQRHVPVELWIANQFFPVKSWKEKFPEIEVCKVESGADVMVYNVRVTWSLPSDLSEV